MPEQVDINLNLTVKGSFDVHHHHHHSPNPSQPGAADILNSIQDLRKTIMTELASVATQLETDESALIEKVDELIASVAGLIEDPSVKAGLTSADADVQEAFNRVTNALNAIHPQSAPEPEPAPAPAQVTIGQTSFTATVGSDFSGDPQLSGGTAPYNVTASPPSDNGLSVGPDGTISGAPVEAGTSVFSFSGFDSSSPPLGITGSVSVDSTTPVG